MSDFDLNETEEARYEQPVLVFSPKTQEEADIVRATLEAEGIPAFLRNPNTQAGMSIVAENVDTNWVNGIYVSTSYAEAAQALLNAPMPTEAELTAEEEADPTTLAEAEAAVKDA